VSVRSGAPVLTSAHFPYKGLALAGRQPGVRLAQLGVDALGVLAKAVGDLVQ
jgi:hypothetical protein